MALAGTKDKIEPRIDDPSVWGRGKRLMKNKDIAIVLIYLSLS
jgi:hypothetical protein